MKKYPSKISYGLLLFVLVILVGSTIPMLSPPRWLALCISVLVLTFVLSLFYSTYYIIDGNWLLVKASFVVNKKIDIQNIKIIAETNSLISSPAASLDRLEIIYNKHSGIVISPKDKLGFIEHITKVNPEIVIQYKVK